MTELSKKKSKTAYFLAFIIPVTLLVIIYWVREIYPFGNNCFLRSDMYHQYAPFLKEFYTKLTEGGDFTYSWNIGMGVNFTALYAYYLASPLNWVVGLISSEHIIEIMSVFIILKTGLASLTFSFYLSKHFNTRHVLIAAFSSFYALSSYMAAYNWNVMWLDCIVLLPLVVLGIERLVKENKCTLYCVSLALCIISNYYISIMVCIFSVLYFAAVLFSTKVKDSPNRHSVKIFKFLLYSLIAGGLAAFLLLPVYYALQLTASGEFSFPDNLSRYFSLFETLSRGLMNVEPAIFSAHEANIYSSVIVFLMLPLYLFNKNISGREKAAKTILIVIFLLSFNFNIPNYIWHGFHFPNSLPCRESFIFIFLLLSMSFEAFIDIKKYTGKQIYGSFAGVFALFLLFEQLFVNEESYSFNIIYLSLLFLSLYLLVIKFFRTERFNKSFAIYLLFIIVICETAINTNATAFGTTSRVTYVSDNVDVDNVVSTVQQEDTGFYRIEKLARRTKNDASWHNYKGVSVFSSTANAGVTEYLGSLGFEQSMNAYAFYGHTPLTASLLSVKYVLSNELLEESSLMSLYDNSGDVYLYKNNYTLPLGIIVENNLENSFYTESDNPFVVQNNFVQETTGYTNMFNLLQINNSGSFARIQVEETSNVYAYIYSDTESVSADIINASGITINTKTYNNLKHHYIIDLGYIDAGCTISITPQDSDNILNIYGASFDEEVFKSAFEALNSNSLKITSYSDTLITGTVSTETDGLILTSIPYDKGFTVYVDGVKTNFKAFKDAFISIPVSKGEHSIELKYYPQGLLAGSVISMTSLAVFIVLTGYSFLQKRRKGY